MCGDEAQNSREPGAIGSLDLQHIGEDHFVADPLKRFFTQLNGHNLGCEASVDIRASRQLWSLLLERLTPSTYH
jgi:hypothetical protein